MDDHDKAILLLDTLDGLAAPLSDAFNNMTMDLCQQALTIDSLDREVSRLKRDRHEWKVEWKREYKARWEAEIERLAMEAENSRLWACINKIDTVVDWDDGEMSVDTHDAMTARDLDALCAALKVEVETANINPNKGENDA
jgi:hypothetical protein